MLVDGIALPAGLTLKPWITTEIQKLVRIRDRLFERKKDNLIMNMSEKSITGQEIE